MSYADEIFVKNCKDILEKGAYKENPLIGHISTKEEIQEELEELLMSM